MSNPESFIEEVSEEVRRDRLYRALRKYGWIGVLAVVLIVGGAAWNEWRKARAEAAAQAYGDALYQALDSSETEGRLAALGDIATPEGAEPMTALIYATEAQGRSEQAALDALEALVADPATPPLYADLARLRMVMIGTEVLEVSERQALLDPLTQGDGPYRLLALEQRALIEAELGQTDAAIETLRGLLDAAGASDGLRSRALQMIVALGGDIPAQG